MPRRGWSSIATPSGWYEVIRGLRPPSVQWPHVSKVKDQGKGKKTSPIVSAPRKSQEQSKVARLEAALQALGQEQSPAKTALEEALKMAKEDVPKPVHPTAKVCRSISSCGALGSRSESVGRGGPDAEHLKAALKQARIHARLRPVGERLDLCLRCVARVEKQVARAEEQVRDAMEVQRQMEEKLANGLRDLEVLRGEASQQPRTHQDPSAPSRGMEVEPSEEITRLRAQVAEVLSAREPLQDSESIRPKKSRTTVATDIVPVSGGQSASDLMSTWIDAADSTLREAGRGVP